MARDGHVDEAGSGGAPGGLTRHRTPLRDNLEWIAFIVLVVLVVRQMVVEAFRIQHGSMAPTLLGIHKEIRCPNCDRVCEEMAMIWASGPLLATREDMADIADAIEKVYENRDKLRSI